MFVVLCKMTSNPHKYVSKYRYTPYPSAISEVVEFTNFLLPTDTYQRSGVEVYTLSEGDLRSSQHFNNMSLAIKQHNNSKSFRNKPAI